MEAVAGGLLLPGGPGLGDPCEKDNPDAATALTAQQREDLTCSAQYALRLIAYRQIYKVNCWSEPHTNKISPFCLTGSITTIELEFSRGLKEFGSIPKEYFTFRKIIRGISPTFLVLTL